MKRRTWKPNLFEDTNTSGRDFIHSLWRVYLSFSYSIPVELLSPTTVSCDLVNCWDFVWKTHCSTFLVSFCEIDFDSICGDSTHADVCPWGQRVDKKKNFVANLLFMWIWDEVWEEARKESPCWHTTYDFFFLILFNIFATTLVVYPSFHSKYSILLSLSLSLSLGFSIHSRFLCLIRFLFISSCCHEVFALLLWVIKKKEFYPHFTSLSCCRPSSSCLETDLFWNPSRRHAFLVFVCRNKCCFRVGMPTMHVFSSPLSLKSNGWDAWQHLSPAIKLGFVFRTRFTWITWSISFLSSFQLLLCLCMFCLCHVFVVWDALFCRMRCTDCRQVTLCYSH